MVALLSKSYRSSPAMHIKDTLHFPQHWLLKRAIYSQSTATSELGWTRAESGADV